MTWQLLAKFNEFTLPNVFRELLGIGGECDPTATASIKIGGAIGGRRLANGVD